MWLINMDNRCGLNPVKNFIAMKNFLTLSILIMAVQGARASAACGPITIAAVIEVPPGNFTAADLLPPGACPALVTAAARVHLGNAPLEGSMRVLSAADIRALFKKLRANFEGNYRPSAVSGSAVNIPDRVVVRRSGGRASCPEIAERVVANSRKIPEPSRGDRTGTVALSKNTLLEPELFDTRCGAAGRIPETAPLAIEQSVWNPALESWLLSAHCQRTTDCVPFLVRVKSSASEPPAIVRLASDSRTAKAASAPPLIRPGQTATLVWEQNGIRLVVPVTCLDRGTLGESVRARISPSGQVVRAVVVEAGLLRAAS
jgi:hypothetical protein